MDCEAHTQPQTETDSKIQCSTLQHNDTPSPSLLDTHKQAVDTSHSLSSALPLNKASEENFPDVIQSPSEFPIYTMPDKAKKKVVISQLL